MTGMFFLDTRKSGSISEGDGGGGVVRGTVTVGTSIQKRERRHASLSVVVAVATAARRVHG
jgi:hypothetical protein